MVLIDRLLLWGCTMTVMLANTSASSGGQISAAEALQEVRQAIGFEALSKQSNDVVVEGTAEYLGMPASYRLMFSPKGAFRQTIEAHGDHVVASDGKISWERAFSRPARLVDFGEAEMQRALMAIRTHHWLAEDSLYRVVVRSDGETEVALELSSPSAQLSTQVVLDRRTWLPIRVSRPWLFGNVVLESSDYADYHGIKWPRKSILHRGQASDRFDVSNVRLVSRTDPSAYDLPERSSSVRWDKRVSSAVEVKRMPSGHLFVKAAVNGQDVGWFAFDTGTGSGLTISRKVADQLHLAAFGKTFAGGAGQQSPIQFREAASIQIGPARMGPIVFHEVPPAFTDSMAKHFGFEWAGTIGHAFLAQAVAELDLSAPSLHFHDPASYELPQGNWQQLRFNRGIPCLKCKVENRDEGWFQLDTGAGAFVMIHAPAVQQYGLLQHRSTQKSALQGVGGGLDAEIGTLKEFSVGARAFSNVLTFFVTGKQGALVDPYTMGTFGAALLRGDKVIFDYTHQRAAIIPQQ
jgi:hypothetical protein